MNKKSTWKKVILLPKTFFPSISISPAMLYSTMSDRKSAKILGDCCTRAKFTECQELFHMIPRLSRVHPLQLKNEFNMKFQERELI